MDIKEQSVHMALYWLGTAHSPIMGERKFINIRVQQLRDYHLLMDDNWWHDATNNFGI
jgi:hypothetical protein